jgi:hypothetical protein
VEVGVLRDDDEPVCPGKIPHGLVCGRLEPCVELTPLGRSRILDSRCPPNHGNSTTRPPATVARSNSRPVLTSHPHARPPRFLCGRRRGTG